MKNFAVTGVAGYIAPRHLKAIKETGNNLVAAIDPNDSVGILDQYSPDTAFFTEYERFDRHLEKLRKGPAENRIDYLSICSPNNLHDAHIRLALRIGADAICEKPLVLNPWNLDALAELEKEYEKKVYTILQLRVHPSLVAVKQKLAAQHVSLNTQHSTLNTKHEVVLTYITSRGLWYNFSWKGDTKKSGGVATNIGVHFFDLLSWYFGKALNSEVHLSQHNKMAGFLELENANVKWFLSIDRNDLPRDIVEKKKTTFRSINIDGEEVEFTEGFTNLHTKVYEDTLAGNGFGIEDARNSIELVHKLRNEKIMIPTDREKMHGFLTKR
jgi:UDP-N-acetyl-2-amino-2-deoxyglucuronate dehydrogenase